MATEDLSSLDASAPLDTSSPNDLFDPTQPGGPPLQESHQAFGILTSTGGYPPGHPALSGEKYYTIQRVNGNGGNGKGDGVPGPHKHTLEDSDRVKKNSVQRYVLKDERDRRKTHVSWAWSQHGTVGAHKRMDRRQGFPLQRGALSQRPVVIPHGIGAELLASTIARFLFSIPLSLSPLPHSLAVVYSSVALCSLAMSDDKSPQPKTYHKRATGLALATVKQRSKESDLKLYGSCFWYVPCSSGV